MQNLFPDHHSNLLPHHGEAYYYPALFSKTESDAIAEALVKNVAWRQEPVKIFGREIMQPRLTAWFGDKGIDYSYSGITMSEQEWPQDLVQVKEKVERLAGVKFNGVLMNLYRDGSDSMGWHRDNEKELGPVPVIASVSFGATRTFQMRTYKEKNNLLSFKLEHGSCLLMRGQSQQFWEHRVPKTTAPIGQRLNLTFRQVIR